MGLFCTHLRGPPSAFFPSRRRKSGSLRPRRSTLTRGAPNAPHDAVASNPNRYARANPSHAPPSCLGIVDNRSRLQSLPHHARPPCAGDRPYPTPARTHRRTSTDPGQVLFGLSNISDHLLQGVTPYYLFAKACLLAWGGSSAGPYGGRPMLTALFRAIGNTDRPLPSKFLAAVERFSARASLPPRLFRFGLAILGFGLATVSTGAATWALVQLEGYFSTQPDGWQAKVCLVCGTAWPIYRTLAALGWAHRSAAEAFAPGKGDRTGGRRAGSRRVGGNKRGASQGGRDTRRRGPAASQWLSYWPIFALLQVALDPWAGRRVPHYYSSKLAAIAFLALPCTRGAYLVASQLMDSGSDEEEMRLGLHLAGYGQPAVILEPKYPGEHARWFLRHSTHR